MKAKKKVTQKILKNNTSDISQSPEKVEAILQGAMQEFLTHGFAGTSMDKVTAAAGVSKTTVYSYFQDKEKLFIALIERLIDNSGCNLSEFNLELSAEPKEILAVLANNLLDRFSKNVSDQPEFLDLIRLMIAESGRFPMLSQYMVSNIDKNFFQIVSKYLDFHPKLQIDDPQATARIFIGTIVHYTMIEYMLKAGDIMPMERERLINCVVNLIVGQQKTDTTQYSGVRDKTPRRKRSSSGKFQQDYKEPKRVRSLRLTDTAWEKLDAIAQEKNITRSELIEIFARGIEEETHY